MITHLATTLASGHIAVSSSTFRVIGIILIIAVGYSMFRSGKRGSGN